MGKQYYCLHQVIPFEMPKADRKSEVGDQRSELARRQSGGVLFFYPIGRREWIKETIPRGVVTSTFCFAGG